LGASAHSWQQHSRPVRHRRQLQIALIAQHTRYKHGRSLLHNHGRTTRQVAKALRVTVASLRMPSCRPASLAALLRAVQDVYNFTFDLPADLAAAVQQRRQAGSLFDEEPALELLSVQGKYGPWKTALHIAWCQTSGRRMSRQETSKRGVSHRVALLFRALSHACRLMANLDYKVWVNHWGRGVTHHSGFIPMLMRLRVIHKSGAKGRGSLCLGLGTGSYRLASSARLTRLGAWVAASDVIAQVLEANSTPRTLEDYWNVWQALEDRRQELPALPALLPHPLPHVIMINACVVCLWLMEGDCCGGRQGSPIPVALDGADAGVFEDAGGAAESVAHTHTHAHTRT